MGNLLTKTMGNVLTMMVGNVLTEGMGKVLDIYTNSGKVLYSAFFGQEQAFEPGILTLRVLQ
ncbi:MAG: hypothetical protein WBC02_11505 [Candidatus Aminicenantaceae bacterium]